MYLNQISFTEMDLITTIHLNLIDDGLFNKDSMKELTDLLNYINDESQSKFVIIKSLKKIFSRGMNFHNFDNDKISYDNLRKWEVMIHTLETIKKISIAVIEGECLNAGLQLALACDFRIATKDSLVASKELQTGILPGHAIFQIVKYCGLGRAIEFVQTGHSYTAEDAVKIGLINRCCEPDKLNDEIDGFVKNFIDVNLGIYLLSRRLLKETCEMSYENFQGAYLAAQHRVISKLNPNLSTIGGNK